MKTLTAKDFFSLETFAHKALWQKEEFVWQALSRMDHYFQEFPFALELLKVPSHVHLDRPEQIFIGEGTVIEPGVYIPKLSGIRIEDLVYLNKGKVEKFINVPTSLEANIIK